MLKPVQFSGCSYSLSRFADGRPAFLHKQNAMQLGAVETTLTKSILVFGRALEREVQVLY